MRPDREVRYAVRVQHFDRDMNCQMATTGMMSQRFGLGDKTSKSQVINYCGKSVAHAFRRFPRQF